MYQSYNPNPMKKGVGDCAIRATAKALDMGWEEAYCALAANGYSLCDLPNANHVWGSCLRERGFKKRLLPESCPDCYTVANFADDHKRGTYVVATAGHVVCVKDGDYFDTWDSGGETPIYYWEKEN